MSKTIEINSVDDLDELSEDDLKYVLQRPWLLPDEVQIVLRNNPDGEEAQAVRAMVDQSGGQLPRLPQGANTGDVNTAGITKEEHEALLARIAQYEASDEAQQAGRQMQEEIDLVGGGEVEWDQDDAGEGSYDAGWNNDRRRVELAKRGLTVEGSKEQMIARLQRSDNDELVEGDEVLSDDEEDDDEEIE